MPKTLFDRKLHAIRGKTVHAQKSRTAEVTICIIPEGLLDRSRQLPYVWKNPGCRRQRPRCHCPGYRMFCSLWSTRRPHRAHIEFNTSWISMKPGQPGQLSRRPWVSRSRSARFLQTLQAGPSAMGIVPTFLNHNEKGLSIVTARN